MITPDNGRLSGVIIPEDITVNNDAGRCGAVVNYTPPTCSQTLTQTGSNSINGGNYHNGYATQHLRAYDLPASGITNGFTVSSVKFGVYSAFEASDSTPLTINVYQCDP